MAAGLVVVVVGQTASGKSALAMKLAERFNGEIIAADSRTVYKGMDIGTAKPTAEERARMKHHLINVVTPDQTFTAADFQTQAKQAIKDIQSRGKLPIMVGGTGLYIDSVLYGFEFRPVNPEQRAKLEKLSVEQLQEQIVQQGLDMPNNPANPRHLVRVLESAGSSDVKKSLKPNYIVVGLAVEPEILRRRIADRVEQMFTQGLPGEVEKLVSEYGWEAPGLTGIGYHEFKDRSDQEEAKQQIETHTNQYAKRQRTWFKRNPDIQWCSTPEAAEQLVEAFLTTKN